MAAKTVSVPDTVNKVIARVAAAEGFKKPSVLVESGCNAEDGYSSLLYKVTISHEGNARSSSPSRSDQRNELALMVKVPDMKAVSTFHKLMNVSECAMYNSVLPAMLEVANIQGPLPWPRCFYASPDWPDTTLVFEDLRVRGFRMADRRAGGMDVAHCRLALAQMAKFHGAGIALQHLRPDAFKAAVETLANPFEAPEIEAMFASMAPMMTQAMAVVAEKYPEGTAVYNKVLQQVQTYATGGVKLLAASAEPAPGTAIVHGDCHSNNVMFRYDKTTGDVEACQLIDFQLSRVGPTALDLATLLLPCTEKSVRDEHWEPLLRGYHTELQSTLRAAGCEDPDAVYSWTQFMECMRKAAPYGFFIAPPMLHAQFADKQAAEDLRSAIHDMGKTEDMPAAFNIPSTDRLKERLIGIVESLVEWDWL